MTKLIDEKTLVDVGLLREWNGRWKFKFSIDGKFKFANSKQSAIERASEAYVKAPKEALFTKDERFREHEREFIEKMDKKYGCCSNSEIERLIHNASAKSANNRASSSREFNSNGGRRSGAAVSSEAARTFADEKMSLERYLEYLVSASITS
ncbi:TPA: hypothetical protein U2J46_003499 [Providencia stuartii]|nr:hypothetical protein [Providencia stuartii]